MRLVVFGGRNYKNQAAADRKLDELQPTLVIHGDCSGADRCAGSWADRNGVPCMAFPAPWNSRFRLASGPIRNGWMLRFGAPDAALAFPGGTGTADMLKKCSRIVASDRIFRVTK